MIKTRHLLTKRIGIVYAGTSWGQSLRGAEKTPEIIYPPIKKDIKEYDPSLEIIRYIKAHNEIQKLPQLDKYKTERQDYEKRIQEKSDQSNPKINLLKINEKACKLIAEDVEKSTKENDLTIVLGGDHSIAVGSCEGHFRNNGDNEPMLVFIDAHADLNTPQTSPSGNLHGMPVSIVCNFINFGFEWTESKLKAENLCYIGLRCVDPGEEKVLKDKDINRIYAKKYNELSWEQKEEHVEKMFDRLRGDKRGDLPIHLSFCVDSLEPFLAPATGTTEPGGLILEDIFMIIKILKKKRLKVRCFDLVEINPVIKNYPKSRNVTEEDVNTTIDNSLKITSELVASQFCKK